jgi:hypothetical protein
MKVLKSLLLSFVLALILTSASSASLTNAAFSATAARFSPDLPQGFAGVTTIPSVDTNVAKTPQIYHRLSLRHSVTDLGGNGDHPLFSNTTFQGRLAFSSQVIISYHTVSADALRQNSASSAAPRAPPF